MDKQQIINQLKELQKMMINTAASMETYATDDSEFQLHAGELRGAAKIAGNWIESINSPSELF